MSSEAGGVLEIAIGIGLVIFGITMLTRPRFTDFLYCLSNLRSAKWFDRKGWHAPLREHARYRASFGRTAPWGVVALGCAVMLVGVLALV